MTTRRNLFIIAGGAVTVGGAAVLTGCRERGAAVAASAVAAGPEIATAVPDVVLADSRQGLLVLDSAGSRRLGAEAVAGADGDLVYAVTPGDSGGSTLVRLDPARSTPTGRTALARGWLPRVISTDGRSCALSRTPASALPTARTRTALLVSNDGTQRRYDLTGVVEPDAFTTDRSGLFVLEWLPATAPDRYRVRLLDLASGVMEPLLTRNKVPVPSGAEEEMRGDGRQSVLSPDRQVLYTLYTHQPGHRHTRDLVSGRPGGVHAFVHVLHLTERWAYCLDLPHPFGEGPAAGHAVAVSADGLRLAVVDVTSGSLAYADTATLTIERVVPVPALEGEAAALVLSPDGHRVVVGAGKSVTVVDRHTGGVTAGWFVPGVIHGMGISRDGTRLYAGLAGEIHWVDANSGALRGRARVDGLTALRHVR